jgi:GMP synthase (glutamine-hydrolysing)
LTRPGIILSGSPYSVYDHDAPRVDPAVFEYGVPVLGICYGLQEIALTHKGKVEPHTHREYGFAKIQVEQTGNELADRLFKGIEIEKEGMQVSLCINAYQLTIRSGCPTATSLPPFPHLSSLSLTPLLPLLPPLLTSPSPFSVFNSTPRSLIP